MCHYRDREYKGLSDAAQLAPEDVLARVHDSILSDTHGGQDGGLCQKPVLRNFLPNPDVITEEDMVLVCSSTTASHCERQIDPVS